MHRLLTRICCLAVLSGAAVSAHAQLAMSYRLDVRPDTPEHTPAAVNRCAGFNWMSSLGACGRELLSRVAPAGRNDSGATFPPSEVAGMSDLPPMGTPAPESRLQRSAGGREALTGSSKSADLLFRFGSKLRSKNSEEGGWDSHRFTDTTYDNYVKTNGHKAVGVELLVPFQ